MDNILVITQNLKLDSLASIKSELVHGSALIVSTQFVFENEREIIDNALGVKCEYLDFADLITDAERQKCDEDAFSPTPKGLGTYYITIKRLKNEIDNNLGKESLIKVLPPKATKFPFVSIIGKMILPKNLELKILYLL